MTPREPRPFAVYGFPTTHDALAAEFVSRAAGLQVVPVPAPKSLGSLCGIALRVPAGDAGAVEAVLLEAGLRWTSRIEMEDV